MSSWTWTTRSRTIDFSLFAAASYLFFCVTSTYFLHFRAMSGEGQAPGRGAPTWSAALRWPLSLRDRGWGSCEVMAGGRPGVTAYRLLVSSCHRPPIGCSGPCPNFLPPLIVVLACCSCLIHWECRLHRTPASSSMPPPFATTPACVSGWATTAPLSAPAACLQSY